MPVGNWQNLCKNHKNAVLVTQYGIDAFKKGSVLSASNGLCKDPINRFQSGTICISAIFSIFLKHLQVNSLTQFATNKKW